MEAKHTPGPWEVRFRFGRRTTVSGRQRFPICDTGTAPLGEANDRREEANAQLIAAAPDLLEDGWSLAVSALQSTRYGKDPDFRDAVDAMLDTCRRAKGEPTFADHQAAKALPPQPRDQQSAGDKSREEP